MINILQRNIKKVFIFRLIKKNVRKCPAINIHSVLAKFVVEQEQLFTWKP